MSDVQRIAVIMSTYNPGNEAEAQVKTILEQENVSVELFIRDDGSAIESRELLKKLAISDRRIHLTLADNVGFKRSFMLAIKAAPDFDFYAFSDQDDVWSPTKLWKLIQKIQLEESDVPVLGLGNGVVTRDSKFLSKLYPNIQMYQTPMDVSFRATYGMSFVMNKALFDYLEDEDVAAFDKFAHDQLAALLATLLGKIVVVDENMIEYIQSDRNASGYKETHNTLFKKLSLYFERFKDWSDRLSQNLVEVAYFLQTKELTAQANDILEVVLSSKRTIFGKLKLIMTPTWHSHSLPQNIVTFILIIKGRV